MKCTLEMQAGKYNSKYGLLPMFKAGLHYGTVTGGEIGSLKKEIIFTGDVLNTSARIQGLCNQFGADLLVSEDLVKVVNLPASYAVTSVGNTLLKGRSVSDVGYQLGFSNLNHFSRLFKKPFDITPKKYPFVLQDYFIVLHGYFMLANQAIFA